MKLLMLCREPRLYSCQRLQEAAQESGHAMDILDPNRCLIKLSENAPHLQLYYQNNNAHSPYLLSGYDAVLPRFGAAGNRMGCAVLRHFEGESIYCLNSASAFLLARDKWQSLQVLMQQHIPVPNSALGGSEFQSAEAVKFVRSPTILKTLSGSQGIGVILAERERSAVSILETLTQSNVPVLLQDFIAEAEGADLRCLVIGDRVVAAMRRICQSGEFRANFHRGGSAEPVQLTAEEKHIAIKAARALGLDVAGVDLIRSAQGPLVLEVNASPGLEMIEKTSGIDIALQMIAYTEKKVKLWRESVQRALENTTENRVEK